MRPTDSPPFSAARKKKPKSSGRRCPLNSRKKRSHLKCISSTCQALSPVCQKFPVDALNSPSLYCGGFSLVLSYFLRFCPPARLTEEEECFLFYSPRFGRENAEEEAHQLRGQKKNNNKYFWQSRGLFARNINIIILKLANRSRY